MCFLCRTGSSFYRKYHSAPPCTGRLQVRNPVWFKFKSAERNEQHRPRAAGARSVHLDWIISLCVFYSINTCTNTPSAQAVSDPFTLLQSVATVFNASKDGAKGSFRVVVVVLNRLMKVKGIRNSIHQTRLTAVITSRAASCTPLHCRAAWSADSKTKHLIVCYLLCWVLCVVRCVLFAICYVCVLCVIYYTVCCMSWFCIFVLFGVGMVCRVWYGVE